ncbi:MAG: hypothetical protein WC700_18550 [Gemmatimonadaceae bacterium]|jgi:hypothetical protein
MTSGFLCRDNLAVPHAADGLLRCADPLFRAMLCRECAAVRATKMRLLGIAYTWTVLPGREASEQQENADAQA